MVKFKCERCSAIIRCSDTNVGKHVVCPTCQHKQVVPRKASPGHSKLLLVSGAAAIALIIVWVGWAILGPEEEAPASESAGNEEADTKAGPAREAPGRRVGERGAAEAKKDPRDAAEKAWDSQQKLYEERRMSERALKEWEARDAREREAERIAGELRKQEERDERERREFERKERLRELAEQRKKQQNP